MKSIIVSVFMLVFTAGIIGQDVMTPELLWQLGRVSAVGVSPSGQYVEYKVTTYNIEENNSATEHFRIPIAGGIPEKLDEVYEEEREDVPASDDFNAEANLKLISEKVKVRKVFGEDYYPEMEESEVQIYDDLMYRHWDHWNDGTYNHVMVVDLESKDTTDIMKGQPYHCPTVPFGGSGDYIFHPDGGKVVYVTKEKTGIDYATSTNTDIYQYDLDSGERVNLTEGRDGYDTSPAFSKDGMMAWLSMAREGYESDKNDIIVSVNGSHMNLTSQWDGTVNSFVWAENGKEIYFVAPTGGEEHLFVVDFPGMTKKMPVVRQITRGQYDITSIVGQSGSTLVVTRTDMNHATELYTVNVGDGQVKQLTHVNDDIYDSIDKSEVKKRIVSTADGEDMVTWVIYPPNFDPEKKYPTLLYCQGGPQGALSQFYSFRWNFQLMAAQGYIVVAPNRRGMPGHGVEWNEQISKDWGGMNMQDYLAAIDDLAKEDYVDSDRLGCVGASYGGYSAFYLAGIHEGRFKSFIAHDGVFNLRSMYGTTEELFFVNWDIGGPYWDSENKDAQRSYDKFNPINMVDRWDTPILIIQGGKDYRVPIGQGLEAFQAARTRGIESRLLFFPQENHWILTPQNGIIWQREFFGWLDKTLGGRS